MRRTAIPIAIFVASVVGQACESVPIDDTRSDSRLFPPAGVVRGTVVYQGPHPCTRNGHVVGNAVLLFFDKNNPPPPRGLATTAKNLGVVTGDVLFASEPRIQGDTPYCPKDHGYTDTVTTSAAFAVSPFDAGEYTVVSFFDYTGDFLPTFKFRNLPEAGDIGGGYLDTADAAKHAGDPNYQPIYFPITVGVPAPVADGGTGLTMPASGFVADNVTVTLGATLPLARPYFYPDGSDAPAQNTTATDQNPGADPAFVPVVTMAQDLQVLAQPAAPLPANVAKFQASFPSVKLHAGVPAAEAAAATDPTLPFHFQLGADPKSLFLWSSGQVIPEGLVPQLFPLAVFAKLVDDPQHAVDVQSLAQQGGSSGPIAVVLGITLGASDDIFDTVLMPQPKAPGPSAAVDHVTVLVRPSALCIDPANPGAGATLVAPFLTGPSSDPKEMVPPGGKPLFDPNAVKAALAPQFGPITIVQGCLPTGRYAMNLIYPTGQAWTVPNESGSCAVPEGTIDETTSPPSCSVHPPGGNPRDVLFSQGTRAVLEITSSQSGTCAQFPVPAACGSK